MISKRILYLFVALCGLTLYCNNPSTSDPITSDPLTLAVSARTTSSITLSWTPSTSPEFVAYKLFRANSAGVSEISSPVATITSRVTTAYIDTNLDSATQFYYRLYNFEGMNAGVATNEVMDSTLRPDPVEPDTVILVASNRTRSSITLSWTPNTSLNFVAYKLFRATRAGVSELSQPVAIITNRITTSYTDTGLDASTVLYYRVYLFRGLNKGVASNEIKDSTLVSNPPNKDIVVMAVSKKTKTSLTLSWTQCAGADFVAYKLFRSDTAGVTEFSTPVAIITNRAATSYTDSGLIAGTILYYRIYQFRGLSAGAASNEIKDSTLSPDSVVPGDIILAVTTRTKISITLSWTQSNNADFVAYKLFKSDTEGVTDLCTPVATITNRVTTSYTDTGLKSGSTVYYRIFNFEGLNTGVPSNRVKDSTLSPDSVTPDDIVLAVSNRTKTSITLSWTQSTSAEFTAYKLFRSDKTEVTDLSTPVATITNRLTSSYTDTDLDSGVFFYYRVYNLAGLSAGIGSNEVKALTLSPEKNNMIYIGPGSFMMGSTKGNTDEMPLHQVVITNGFWLDKTEVTQTDYQELMGVNPSYFNSVTSGPVESVTWFDAVLYCNKRSKRDGLDTVYSYISITGTPGDSCTLLGGLIINMTKNGYRLPTEPEWEFACRAGTTTDFYWGSDSIDNYARYSGNSGSTINAVATRLQNAYGLYDMCGNVFEWCNDWYGSYSSGGSEGRNRIIRGGSWGINSTNLRSAARSGYSPDGAANSNGFRVVLLGRE
jgi:formylglycine-generating enzyme required for sulfatase activity